MYDLLHWEVFGQGDHPMLGWAGVLGGVFLMQFRGFRRTDIMTMAVWEDLETRLQIDVHVCVDVPDLICSYVCCGWGFSAVCRVCRCRSSVEMDRQIQWLYIQL